jgi:hypothetical protein
MASQPGEISRRRVLAGAAWSAPVILLATAVPARAASGDAVLVTNSFGALVTAGEPNNLLRVSIQAVQETAGFADDGPLTFTVTISDLEVTGDVNALTTIASPWTITPSHSGSSWVFVVSYAGGIAAYGYQACGELVLDRPDSAPAGGTINVSGQGASGPIAISGVDGDGNYTYG